MYMYGCVSSLMIKIKEQVGTATLLARKLYWCVQLLFVFYKILL